MKLKELRTRKYVALMIMILIVGAIVGILKIGNMDFDKGKVKVSKAVINNVTSSLSANINEAAVDNLITSKGYDEIDYVIKYSLSTDENIKERNVIIEASLDDNEKYASFKDITNGNVTSTVSENRKNIKITVKNAKVNKENELKLVMKLEGAPNGYKVTPKIKIKEVSEEKYTNLNVQNVEVKNNSLTGNVQDKQSMNVSNIELALKKDGEIIKKTYTDEDGNYVFSDIDEGEYDLEIDEDIYEKVSEEKVNVSGSSKLNIVVKEVTPYKIELKKQITEMTIINGGNTTTYKYGNLDKVQQALRNVKNMTGEVKYKITVQNTGKKSGIVTVVKDEIPEGFTFNKEKNTSWEEKNGVLYNRSLEGITLNAGEKREEGLTLDIESTSEAKTYINKVTAKGEIYENIVYILDGKTYKEDTVLEGEKIKEPKVDNKNFKGWYTDKKYTNKYNFNNEVTKDLVLYGKIEDIKEYTVTYVDDEKIVKTEKVKENGSLNAPEVSKDGHTFKYWSEEPNGKEYDLSTKVTKDITLYSVYEINKYTVTFINEKEKYDEQEIEYGENIKVPTSPSKEYYTFKYWSLEENGDSYDLNTKVTKDITLYSVYDINKYTVTFIDKGKEIDKQELEAGSLVIAPKVSMEGYTFKYWSEKENEKEYNLNLPITRNLTLYSVYEINKYNVEFYDSNKLIKTIKVDYDNTINSNEVPTVSKTGYTFTGWIENNKNFDFTTKIKENKKLYSKYEIIKNAVIFNDENRITTKKVDYNNKVEKIESQGKTGYTFKYWSTTQDGEEFDFNTLITEGITLYAVYDINEYSVNFIDQGNAYGDTQKVKYNNVAVKPETDPIKEGYTFKYWSLEENGVAYDFNTKITKNITLYSVYSVNNYKVSFVDNGTKYVEDETIEYNKVAVKPETDPSKVGHTFKYWSLEENGIAYDFSTKITKDTTLYSVYSVNNYKVSFVDNGTKYIEDETIEYNKAAIKPETDPSKVGHTFKYWSLGENGTAYDFSTKITKDTTLYSVYEANEYTVKFMDGDNLFKQEQVKYGLKATKPRENPTKEHNLFKTWTLNDKEYDFNLPVTDNMILRSSYEEIEKPSISHVPTEWTNNKVTVTITSSHENYKYLYKIDTGEYKEYTGPFDIDYNCTVVAKSVKENVDSITESHDITNIDKIKPIINSLNETNVSGTSFDINVSTIDNESGMKQIHIYKDDLLETTIVYNENYNEEKNSTYTFNDLVSGKDYKIKVITEDVAGNLSEAKEITVKTEEKIVARIIGRENKLFEDENLYENFSSLERAIKACPSNQCTIEMVTDTKESVEVLEGQDITLNINGKTITGVKDTYTINNGGNLIIKDNAEEAGSIVNNAGVALKNETTGVLTLGELEDELVVSTTKPYINGGTFGVVNEYIDKNTKGRFNFYDGMIAGNIAIEGEVNDKPYLYNASVVTSDNRQVATLKILEDAEARIIRTGVYYTKVNEAIEDTNKGTYTEPTTTNTTLMNGFKTNTMYGFTYDLETNTLSSESNRTSKSYTIIDLTGYENDQYLYITSKELSSTYGNFSITVKENDSNGTSINQTKTFDNTTEENKYKFNLEKGKRYYVELIYKVNSSTEDNKVVISNISLQKINRYGVNEATEFKNISGTYNFEYDETTRTLRSNNQYTNDTTAFSYIEVDLTNATEDKEVIINASLDTLYYSNYGNIVIREDNTKLSSASYSELGYLSVNNNIQHYVGPYNYSQVLEKGKKYYIQFYYFKSYDSYSESDYKKYDSKDQFIINSIDVVGIGDKENVDLSTSLKTNYYGIDSYDSSYDQYSISSNAPYGEKFDSYVKVDLTESKTDKIIDFNLALNSYSSIYITSNNKDSKKELIINNMNNTLLSFASNYSYYINGNSNYYDFRDYKYVLPKGSVYYVHFASYNPEGKPNPYIKNISLIPVTDNIINIGTLPHLKGTIDDSNKPADTNLPYVENDGTTDSNFRFIGNNTKNYVKFNNELWRVIGIFNTTDADGNYAKRIKLIRDKSLYRDLNIYLSWDSSDSSINNGTGINEWSQAELMKLLNEGYENNAPNNIYSEDTKCKKGEKENPDLPKYIVDDTIYFDPVKYRICDSESDSCPAWTVMSGNNCTGEYELVYKKSDVYDYSKAVESNGGSYDNVLINYLNKISETWSDKIISPSSESNMNSLFDFTKSKARILNTKELSENNLSQKLSICVSSYIASSPCNYPILVMGESSYYNLAYKKVLNYNFPFSNSNNSYSINPVIKIDLNKVENKSDFIGKEKANNLKLNNSLYWTGKSGYCFIGAGEYNKQCDFSSIGLSNSAKSMIDSVVWNTGALPNDYNTRNNLTALEVYAMERGNNTGKTNMDTTSTNYDNVNRTTTWIGKVGLPYVSDYILSAGNGSSNTRDKCINGNSNAYGDCVSNNSWLNSTNTDGNSLTITPTYGGEYPSNVASIYTSIYSYPAYSSSTIKPTVYLSPKVKITSGSGTQDDPFIIELGKEDNTTLYYGLVPDLIKEDVKEEETEINEEPETLDYTYVKKEPIYGFNYDEEKKVFTNSNKGIANTIAVSYIKIDLTNATSDIQIDINYNISKNDYSSTGFINLMKNNLTKINYNNNTSYSQDSIVNVSSRSSSGTVSKTLEKDNIYYLQFAYKKKGNLPVSDTNADSFEIGITYLNNDDKTNDYIKYDESVPVLNKESDTVQILKDLSLTSPLSIENIRSMVLDLNGHIISTQANDYVIKNSGDLTIVDSKYSNDLLTGENETIKQYRDNISKYVKEYDSYKITDYSQDKLELNLDGIEHGLDSTSWKDSSGKNNNITINGGATFENNYLTLDGIDDYVELGNYNYQNLTIETVFETKGGSSTSYKDILYSLYGNCGYELSTSSYNVNFGYYLNSGTSLKSLKTSLSNAKDKIYYALTFDGTSIKTYMNGILMKTTAISSDIKYDENSVNNVILGASKTGETLKKQFKGNIYSTRIYSRALTEEEIIKNYSIDVVRYDISNNRLTSDTSYGKVTTDSGTSPYLVFDGDTTTFWESENSNESYIQYKLGKTSTLKSFKIYGVNDISKYPSEIEVLGSKDGNTFDSIISQKLEAKGLNEFNEISINNENLDSYSYLKFNFKNSNNIISIGEIKLKFIEITKTVFNESKVEVSGTISSTLNSVIYNASGANLNIEQGIIKLNASGNYNTITNLGNLTLKPKTKIYGSKSNNTGIYNGEDGKLDVSSSYVYGWKYGIYNLSSNNNKIDVGDLAANTYALYNDGENDFEINLNNLSSNNYGLYNNSFANIKLNVKSTLSLGYSGKYGIYNASTGNLNVNIYNLKIAADGSNGIYNNSTGNISGVIKDLYVSSSSSYSKKIEQNTYGIYNNSTGNINLNDSSISTSGYGIYNIGGNISLKSTTISYINATASSTADTYNYYGIYDNSGVLDLDSTTMKTSSSTTNPNGYAIYMAGEVDLKFVNSEISNYGYGIYNTNSNSSLTIESGTINSTNSAIYNGGGTITIGSENTTPNITGSKYAINNPKGSLTINNGNISSSEIAINSKEYYYTTTSSIYINGGKITGNTAININGSNLEVNSGTIIGKAYGINNGYYKNTMNISESNISAEGNKGIGVLTESPTVITNSKIIVSGVEAHALETSRNLSLSNVNIEATGVSSYGLIVNSGTLDFESSSISAISNGSTGLSVKNGTANLINGSIKANAYGVINSGTVVLGEKDGVVTKQQPNIVSDNYGIYTSTKAIKFYDGIITGSKENAFDAIVSDSEENYDLYIAPNSENSSKVDVTLEIPTKEKFGEVAEVDGVTYPSVKSAFDSITSDENKTVKLLKSTKTILKLGESSKNISINTNGNTISYFGSDTYLINKNTLNIYSETGNKSGIISKNPTIVDNYGTLTTDNSSESYLLSYSSDNYIIKNNIDATTNINSGVKNIYVSDGNSYYHNSVDNYGTLLIKNSYIYGMINNVGTSKISNSNLYSNDLFEGYRDKSETINNTGNLIVDNSNVYSSDGYGIYNDSGTIDISQGIVYDYASSGIAIYNKSGEVTLANIDIQNTKSNGTGIYNYGTVTLESGTVSGNYGVDNYGTFNMKDGIVKTNVDNGIALKNSASNSVANIYDGEISTFARNSIAINNRLGEMNIYGGDIIANTVSSNAITIGTGILNLGVKGDGSVSKTNPSIEATSKGIINQNSGTFNFYDGKIVAQSAITGTINEIEDGYSIVGETLDDGRELKYLDKIPTIKNLTTNEKYVLLSEAVNEASSGDTLQYIAATTVLSSETTVEIISEKEITIDINGNSISIDNDLYINNKGTLKIIDSKNTKNEDGSIEYGSGRIETTGKSLIKNTGSLIIDSAVIVGKGNTNNLISNTENGSLKIENTKASFLNEYSNNDVKIVNGIYNSSSNEVIINNTKINNKGTDGRITGYALYNDESGKVKITDSDFTLDDDLYTISKSIYNNGNGTINANNSILSHVVNNSLSDINLENCTLSDILNSLTGNINLIKGNIINTANDITNIYNKSKGTVNIDGTNIKLQSSSYSVYSIENNGGIINIDNATIFGSESINNESGTININNSNLTGGVKNTGAGIINVGKADSDNNTDSLTTMTSSIENRESNIFIYNGSTVSGTITNYSGNIYIYKGGTIGGLENHNGLVEVYGMINGRLNSVYNSSTGYGIKIYEGSVITTPIENYSGNIEVYGATLNKITNRYDGTINIRNSTTDSIKNDGTINMYSGSILSSDIAVVNQRTFNLYGGNIESTANSGISSDLSTSVINIGAKGDVDENNNLIVSNESPIIKGKNYGILIKSGQVNFYDGKIIGQKSISGDLYSTEIGYDTVTTTDSDRNEVTYLSIQNYVKNLSTNKEYSDLQTAINEASNGDSIQFTNDKHFLSGCEIINIDLNKNIIIDINGKNISYTTQRITGLIINDGILKIIDSVGNGLMESIDSKIIENNGTLEIDGANLSSKNPPNQYGYTIRPIVNKGTLIMNSGTINSDGRSMENSGKVIINGGTLSLITNTGTLNVNGGNISSINNTGTATILGGTISSGGIYNSSKGILNVGEKNGIVNITNPVIQGKTYAVSNEGIFNFYDGKLVGNDVLVSGTITEVEPGYKLSINDDSTNNKKIGYLVVIADDERVAMVNGINFTSLQTAINSVKDNTESNIVIYKDIELTEDIIVPENKIINLYLNGHTITYGDYNFVKNGTLTIIDSAPSESIGASIINTIEKVLNINQNGKNIIVYEMSDGSNLSTENTYNLYKKVDNEYKLLNMEKDEEVGRYITGSNNSEMTSIKGRIYLNNLEEGSYKLVSSDNKDIEFTITEDGKLNGNILENTNEKRKVIETAFAYLIITIQTGVNQIKYIIYIVAIVSIILGLYFAFKEQRKLSRKV